MLVERVIRRGAPAGEVVAGGGVITAQPLLYESLAEEMRRALPATRLTLWRTPPVEGAVTLARHLVGAAMR